MTDTGKLNKLDSIKVNLILLGERDSAEAIQEMQNKNSELLEALKEIRTNSRNSIDQYGDIDDFERTILNAEKTADIAIKKAEG